MNDERVQILRMVQEGKVSPEEAAKLLDALEQPEVRNGARQKPRTVRVIVVEGNSKSNLVLSANMARWILQMLQGLGLPLNRMAGLTPDMVLDALAHGSIGKVFDAEEGKLRVEVWLDA